ncbi:hypothetical protein CVV68_11460 [Arthrobacter livingstonensis]|uniref:Uncharacterized protein n=1 Tax=Arthrobacter livingstonensis TaxID=670078 RepID=A0A2V5LJ38_9MICC|nr:hypothetical protein CVV68_11460 [Arthrobacter livingstonensis]
MPHGLPHLEKVHQGHPFRPKDPIMFADQEVAGRDKVIKFEHCSQIQPGPQRRRNRHPAKQVDLARLESRVVPDYACPPRGSAGGNLGNVDFKAAGQPRRKRDAP